MSHRRNLRKGQSMNLSTKAKQAGERIMVAAIAVYGENAVLSLSNLVAALSEGMELDLSQGMQEARRVYLAGNNAIDDAADSVSRE
jgi:hypothetical protein